jgi:hypothetical protein
LGALTILEAVGSRVERDTLMATQIQRTHWLLGLQLPDRRGPGIRLLAEGGTTQKLDWLFLFTHHPTGVLPYPVGRRDEEARLKALLTGLGEERINFPLSDRVIGRERLRLNGNQLARL